MAYNLSLAFEQYGQDIPDDQEPCAGSYVEVSIDDDDGELYASCPECPKEWGPLETEEKFAQLPPHPYR